MFIKTISFIQAIAITPAQISIMEAAQTMFVSLATLFAKIVMDLKAINALIALEFFFSTKINVSLTVLKNIIK